MEHTSGGLKDIFSTILNETGKRADQVKPHRIVVHGNGNVIAPGGTVHVMHAAPLDGPGAIASERTPQ